MVSQVNDSIQPTTQVFFAGIDSIQLITQETSENIDSNRLWLKQKTNRFESTCGQAKTQFDSNQLMIRLRVISKSV